MDASTHVVIQPQIDRLVAMGLPIHGPLACGEEIADHTHKVPGAYVACGAVKFHCNDVVETLGTTDESFNAVLVPSGTVHGWEALEDEVRIVQIHGEALIRATLPELAAAL